MVVGSKEVQMINGSALPRLPKADVERLHEASLQVLAEKGIAVYDEELRGYLLDAGAVPSSDQLLRLPRSLVERALSQAPRDLRLYDMLGNHIDLKAGARFLTAPGDSLHFYDAASETLRDPQLDDVAPYVRLADALPEIAMTRGQPMTLVQPEGILGILLVTEQLLLNTTKHHFISPIGVDMVDVWIDVASIVSRGETISERPFFSAMICPVSPLRIGLEGEQKLVALAKHKIPISATCCPIMGATAPYTQAGTLALMNAENLAILVSAQVVQPGTPVFLAPAPSLMDMVTAAICMATPEFFQMHLGAMSLADHYGLPSYHQLAHTDSPSLDYQAGLERGLSMLAWWLAGPAMIGSAGQFHKATVASPEQLLMDSEWYRHVRTLCASFAVNDEELALDEIADTEPGGNFLIARRTLAHLRDGSVFSTQVFNRDSLQGTPRPAIERARERVADIVSTHTPEVPPDIADEIRSYIGERLRSADKRGELEPHQFDR